MKILFQQGRGSIIGSLTTVLLASVISPLLVENVAAQAAATPATTSVRICSKNTNVINVGDANYPDSSTDLRYSVSAKYNILGTNTVSLRNKLTNTDLFGLDANGNAGSLGPYNFSFVNYGSPTQLAADGTSYSRLEAACDIWFSGNEVAAAYTAAEIDAVLEFVEKQGERHVLITSCDAGNNNGFCADDSVAIGTLSGSVVESEPAVFIPGLAYQFSGTADQCSYIANDQIVMIDDGYFALADGTNLVNTRLLEVAAKKVGTERATAFTKQFSFGGIVAGFSEYTMLQNNDTGGTATLSSGNTLVNNNDHFAAGMFSRIARFVKNGDSSDIFGSSTSIGNAISIATTNDEGESSVAQAFSRPIFNDFNADNEASDSLYWTGELRMFFIDKNGIFREDTVENPASGVGRLDPEEYGVLGQDDSLAVNVERDLTALPTKGNDRAFKLVYNEAERTTQVQYLKVGINNDGTVYRTVEDGPAVASQELNSIWSASEKLDEIAKTKLSSNRAYATAVDDATGGGRYIFTSYNNTLNLPFEVTAGALDASHNTRLNLQPASLADFRTKLRNEVFNVAIDGYNADSDGDHTNGKTPLPNGSNAVITSLDELAEFLMGKPNAQARTFDNLIGIGSNGKTSYTNFFVNATGTSVDPVTGSTVVYNFMTAQQFTDAQDAYLNFQPGSLVDLVEWVRGVDAIDSSYRSRTSSTTGKQYLLGDIENSNPVQVIEAGGKFKDPDYTSFKTLYQHRRRMVYVGANDGMLHAFNAGFWNQTTKTFQTTQADITSAGGGTAHPLGSEMWAYIPENALPKLKTLAETSYQTGGSDTRPAQHEYFVDGAVQAFDVEIFTPSAGKNPGGWGTILVAATGYGGHKNTYDDGSGGTDETQSSIIVFDITDPEVEPVVIEVITAPGLKMATTKPTIYRDATGTYLAFGSGASDITTHSDIDSTDAPYFYLYKLDAASGVNPLTSIELVDGISNNSLVGDPAAMDWDGDANNYDEAIYFGTVEERIPGLLSGGTLLPALAVSGDLRVYNDGVVNKILDPGAPISVRPHLSKDSHGQAWITVGTGKTFASTDIKSTAQQYSIGLKQNFNPNLTNPLLKPQASVANLQNVNGIAYDITTKLLTFPTPFVRVAPPALGDSHPSDINTVEKFNTYLRENSSVVGWKRELAAAVSPSGSERVTSPSISISDLLLFATFTETTSNFQCSTTGQSQLYGLDKRNGMRFVTGNEEENDIFLKDDAEASISTNAGKGIIDDLTIFPVDGNEIKVLGPNDLGEIPSIGILPPTQILTTNFGRKSWTEIDF